MSEMKPPPEIVFAEQLEEAFTAMANEAFSPPHTIDAETMRQIKEGIAAARERLTEAQVSNAITEVTITASHPEIVQFAIWRLILDPTGLMHQICETVRVAFAAKAVK